LHLSVRRAKPAFAHALWCHNTGYQCDSKTNRKQESVKGRMRSMKYNVQKKGVMHRVWLCENTLGRNFETLGNGY
jgi:hypothetical protein